LEVGFLDNILLQYNDKKPEQSIINGFLF